MQLLRKGSDDKSKPWYRLSSYRKYMAYKWRFLAFICIWIMIANYLFYPSSISQSSLTIQQRSSFCPHPTDHAIIDNICSFMDALDINTWINKECHFKTHKEGRRHWVFGKIMTLWDKIFENPHCSAINIHKLLNDSEHKIKDDEKFTIIINTWQRNECLTKSIVHYLTCNQVAQIRVIWSDPSNEIPDFLKNMQSSDERLQFDEYKDDKLTNRFKWNSEWITNGIFQTDDDIMFSCEMIANTFKLWQLLPNYLIGFAPRQPLKDFDVNTKQQFYKWKAAYSECRYSLLFSTLGGFMHRKYYKMYTDAEEEIDGWKQIKESVDGNITAEDISMSLLYSFKTEYAPITVIVPESEMFIDDFLSCSDEKSSEMHTNSGKKRTDIFLDILKLFGYFDDEQKFDLISSSLWVDVMPFDEQKCWAG